MSAHKICLLRYLQILYKRGLYVIPSHFFRQIHPSTNRFPASQTQKPPDSFRPNIDPFLFEHVEDLGHALRWTFCRMHIQSFHQPEILRFLKLGLMMHIISWHWQGSNCRRVNNFGCPDWINGFLKSYIYFLIVFLVTHFLLSINRSVLKTICERHLSAFWGWTSRPRISQVSRGSRLKRSTRSEPDFGGH